MYAGERSSSLQMRAKVSSRGILSVVMYCVTISGETPIFAAISTAVSPELLSSEQSLSFIALASSDKVLPTEAFSVVSFAADFSDASFKIIFCGFFCFSSICIIIPFIAKNA